jgi:hypothetical protein
MSTPTEQSHTLWQPPLTHSLSERGPLPKHLNLPYLDEMRLVADAEKIAIKQVTGLERELKFFKFVSTWLGWFFGLTMVFSYFSFAIANRSLISDAALSDIKFALPIVLICLLIRQTCILLDKKYVKKPNFAPVVFDCTTHTLSITHGWKREKTEASFDFVHAYIRYLSTPTGLSQPRLMLKLFDEQAPHKVRMHYFLDLGPAETEYQLAAQWCVICRFMDTNRDYPYNPQFWDAGLQHHYPEDFATVETKDVGPEAGAYYQSRLMDYALDQNAMGMIGAERDAGLKGVFQEDNPARRTIEDLNNRRLEIATEVAELENLLGIRITIPPAGLWCREP